MAAAKVVKRAVVKPLATPAARVRGGVSGGPRADDCTNICVCSCFSGSVDRSRAVSTPARRATVRAVKKSR